MTMVNPEAQLAQMPPSEVRWEYRLVETSEWKNAGKAEDMFNELGEEGWELVAMSIFGTRYNRAGAVFKRRLA